MLRKQILKGTVVNLNLRQQSLQTSNIKDLFSEKFSADLMKVSLNSRLNCVL